MADCHDLFLNYGSKLILTSARITSLKKSRKELRKKVDKYFDENKKNEIKPKFYSQGSFVMETIINPIADEEGNINVPDHLDEMVNKVGNQILLHTISGKNQVQTIVDIVHGMEQHFNKDILKFKEGLEEILNGLEEESGTEYLMSRIKEILNE